MKTYADLSPQEQTELDQIRSNMFKNSDSTTVSDRSVSGNPYGPTNPTPYGPTNPTPYGPTKPSVSSSSRAQDIRTAVPTNPAGSTSAIDTFQNSISSLLQTGTTTPQMATLVNTQTGDRKAVVVGSEEAQTLFGQGYSLENGAPAGGDTGVIAEGTSLDSVSTIDAAITRLSFLKNQKEAFRQEAFKSVYSYSPEEWQSLDPQTQRQLRNQRVQGLLGAVGNIDVAISQVETEMENAKSEAQQAKDDAVKLLDLYLSNGVLGQLSEAKLSDLAGKAGLDLDAVKAMGSSEDAWELKQLGGSLYKVKFDPVTGDYQSELLQGSSSGGGGGGGGSGGAVKVGGGMYPKEFSEWYSAISASQGALKNVLPGEEPAGPVNSADQANINQAYDFWLSNIVTKDAYGDTQEVTPVKFEDDLNDGIAAALDPDSGISGKEAYNRLRSTYGSEIEKINSTFALNGISIN